MRNNSLQQFVTLRRELTQEKQVVEARLREITEALGEVNSDSPPTPAPASPPEQKRKGGGRRGRGSGKSLKAFVLEVLEQGPLTKEEVLKEVKQRGYKFQTSDPANSLGVILYGKNPKFNREDGKFSLGTSSAARPAAAKGKRGGRRTMSAEGRARIAEGQRKRWAAARKAR